MTLGVRLWEECSGELTGLLCRIGLGLSGNCDQISSNQPPSLIYRDVIQMTNATSVATTLHLVTASGAKKSALPFPAIRPDLVKTPKKR